MKAAKLFTIFLHREDSKPDRVALRNRLAPTQSFSSLTFSWNRPTDLQAGSSFRSGPETFVVQWSTIAASQCSFARRSIGFLGSITKRGQAGGLQADGFRRTISFDKNQRGVWEHLI
ncbi:MAG TPA: hypothetical protein DDZ51_04520 [Planctomycetaceae bacterium]|nr:hypothetical protein [Planctomycetaceae bacterium]